MDANTRKKILAQKSTGGQQSQLARVRQQLTRLKDLELPPDYDRYMRSTAWKTKRAEALDHYGHTCTLCGQTEKLHVHHLHYQSVGQEKMEDLTVCCQGCHYKLHLPSHPELWAGTHAQPHISKPPASTHRGKSNA